MSKARKTYIAQPEPGENGVTIGKNGFTNTVEDPMFKSLQDMREFMRDQFRPKPKEVKHVVLDADGVLWDIEPWGIASIVSPVGETHGDLLSAERDFSSLDPHSIPDYWRDVSPTGHIRLLPKVRDTIEELNKRGIKVSIASCNDATAIIDLLEAFKLADKITSVRANWYESKGEMVNTIAKRDNEDTAKMLFVNDDWNNVFDVSARTKATGLVMGASIDQLDEILDLIK